MEALSSDKGGPACSDDSATRRRKEAESRLRDADDAATGVLA